MKLYELSKKTGISVEQLKEELGYKSHMKKVPDSVVAEYLGEEKKIETEQEGTQTVDSAETVVVETSDVVEPPVIETESKEECPVSLEELRGGINGLGGKYKHYKWRHLLDA